MGGTSDGDRRTARVHRGISLKNHTKRLTRRTSAARWGVRTHPSHPSSLRACYRNGFLCCVYYRVDNLLMDLSYNLRLGYRCASLCIVLSSVSFNANIFYTLRHNRVQAQGQQNQNSVIEQSAIQEDSTVYRALWVELVLAVCCLPYTQPRSQDLSLRFGKGKVLGTRLPYTTMLYEENYRHRLPVLLFTATSVFINSPLNIIF